MKKKALIAALACALLLTGCGATDMPHKYSKELKYTLGEYNVKYNDVISSDNYKTWDISFTTKSGRNITSSLYSEKSDKDEFKSRKENDDNHYWYFYALAMDEIAIDEFNEKITAKYFDRRDDHKYDDSNICYCEPSFSAVIDKKEGKYSDYIDSYVSAKNGKKLSDMDLQSIACEKMVCSYFRVVLKEGVDPEPYIEKMKLAVADFESITGSPLNYSFYVQVSSNSGEKNVYRKDVLFGKEIDFEAKSAKAEANGEKYYIIHDVLKGVMD